MQTRRRAKSRRQQEDGGERYKEPAQHALVYVKIVFDRPWGLGSEIETPPSKTTIFRASLSLSYRFSISDNLRNANLIRCALTPSPYHSPTLSLCFFICLPSLSDCWTPVWLCMSSVSGYTCIFQDCTDS